MTIQRTSKKALQRSIIATALGGLSEIRPLMHRTKFSGNYDYGYVEEKLKDLKIDSDYGKMAVERNYSYKRKAYRKLKGGTAVFLFKTPEQYDDPQLLYLRPQCIVETSNSTPEFLSMIDKALPGLKIMSVEYAIDFYCKDSDTVANLFYLLRRYTYIHHAKQVSMDGGEFDGWKEPRDINAVYKIHFQERRIGTKKIFSGKYVKVYERGEDRAKKEISTKKKGRGRTKKKGWLHTDTNRVRLEVTISKRNRTLAKNHGIKNLKDLLLGPKFQKILFPKSSSSTPTRKQDQIQFKNFVDRKSNRLPKDYPDYNTEDGQGNIECFMNEYFRGKELGINLSRETEHTKDLEPFKARIIEATRLFDQRWQKKVKKLGLFKTTLPNNQSFSYNSIFLYI